MQEVATAPPTAGEVAQRVVDLIEGATGKAGGELSRVWPEVVAARWAEAIWSLVAAGVMLAAGITIAMLAVRWARRKVKPGEPEWALVIMGSAMIILLPALMLLIEGPGWFAAVMYPEGVVVREMVTGALR